MGLQISTPCLSEAKERYSCWASCHDAEVTGIEHVISPAEAVAEVSLPLGDGIGASNEANGCASSMSSGGPHGTSRGASSSRHSGSAYLLQSGGASSSSYRSFDALKAVVNTGDVELVRGSWLVTLCKSGGILPRRQELPPEAVCVPEAATTYPVVAISYCWESLQHPDPHGAQLQILSSVIDQWIKWHRQTESPDLAVFLDWCSLYQEPRSSAQKASFERCLHFIGLWYAHSETCVWLLTRAPTGGRQYDQRGWPTFERAISQMITPASNVLDLGCFDGRCRDWLRTQEVCKARRQPPMVPETFSKELHRKAFAEAADFVLVDSSYRDTFEDLMGSATQLEFRCLGWGDGEAHRLAEAIPRCSGLSELVLRENRIGDDGAEKLAAVISHCRRLQRLDLCSNEVGDRGAGSLAEALPCCGHLQALELARNGVGDGGAKRIAAVLPRCSGLQRLVLGGNEIGDSGAGEIAAALPDCIKLQVLDLSENEIGDAGAERLAVAMSRCSRLQRVDLARNRIGDGGAEQLAAAIPQCSRLQELGLGGNEIGEILGGGRIGDGGAETLASALLRCGRLRKLDLSENRIGDRGTEKLAAVMPHCSHLAELDLCRNSIADSGAGKLAEAVPRCGRLEQLRVSGNPLGRGGERCLREAWRSAGKPEEQLLCCR
mmetsp:Transcript_84728/g.274480  ORF Transcript_84728/g.274480 Transcript_84728/m.274480 type:complete len:663 (+) Transcript_84728:83-2071(+)